MGQSLLNLVKSEDLFKSLSSESEKSLDKRIEVYPNENIQELLRIYENFDKNFLYKSQLNSLEKLIKKPYSYEDILGFYSIIRSNIPVRNSIGALLSLLIKHSNLKEFHINTKNVNNIDYIGNYNKNTILTIDGNVGLCLGQFMSGGKIIVNGNCGEYCGSQMHGGEIHVNGDITSISGFLKKGNIYNNGKLIIKNGNYVWH